MVNKAILEQELCVSNLEEPPLQKELTFGRSYRILKEADGFSPIKPKHSPVNVPFKLCRAAQKPCRNRKRKPCKCSLRSRDSKRSPTANVSLLDRSTLTQEKYMELLARPHKHYKRKRRSRRKANVCRKCRIEPCPPRIIQMSIPLKRYVLENWKAFEHLLPAEVLMRFDEILKSGDNLEPRDARHYFKRLQEKKRKEVRRRRRICKKMKEARRRGERMWLKGEIEDAAGAIAGFIKREPLFMLNFQQMMTSNELLKYLADQKVVKIRSRRTKCVYKKTVIEISDKLVKWLDAMNFFVDAQPIDSNEKLVLQIPSLESLLEEEIEEVEEEEEGGGEEELGKITSREKEAEMYGKEEEEEEEQEAGSEKEGIEEILTKKILDKIGRYDEFEGEGMFDFLDLDEDSLEKLIQILSESPTELLLEEIERDNLPGITYGDILEKLKQIRDGNLLEPAHDQLFLEKIMTEWAKSNDPERVDDKVLDKIHETSTILVDWFKTAGLSEFGQDTRQPGEDRERYGIDEFGEDEIPIEEIYEKSRGPETIPGISEEEERFLEQEKEYEGEMERDEYQGEYGEYDTRISGYDQDIGGTGFDDETLRGEGVEEDELYGEDEREYFERDESEKPLEGAYLEDEDFGLEEERIELQEGEEEGLGIEGEGIEGEEHEFEEDQIEGYGVEGEGLELKEEEEEEEEAKERIAEEIERLDSLLGVIRGHKPSSVFEHEPGTLCCLSLKTWAAWLLEIANNAHKWTKWIRDIIKQVRYYAAVVRGDIVLPSGEKKLLRKEEWRKFVKDTEEKVIAWRQYSAHVKDLSQEIMENFHGKPVKCCPKCLQDHLIKNVVTAHETLQALTEAISCANYWQRCLDRIVEQAVERAELADTAPAEVASLKSEESYTIEIEELARMPQPVAPQISLESVHEFEEITDSPNFQGSDYEIVEVAPEKPRIIQFHELEEISTPAPSQTSEPAKHEQNKQSTKRKKPNQKKKR